MFRNRARNTDKGDAAVGVIIASAIVVVGLIVAYVLMGGSLRGTKMTDDYIEDLRAMGVVNDQTPLIYWSRDTQNMVTATVTVSVAGCDVVLERLRSEKESTIILDREIEHYRIRKIAPQPGSWKDATDIIQGSNAQKSALSADEIKEILKANSSQLPCFKP